MLDQANALPKPETQEIKERLDAVHQKLANQQLSLKENKLPVIVLFEGWGAAGKGSMIGKIIKTLDPRFFSVNTLTAPTQEETRRPFLYRYFSRIPEAGSILFLDGGWMADVTQDVLRNDLDPAGYKSRINSIRRFESTLTANGYLVLKFFFHINQKEQKKRLALLREESSTAWRVSKFDRWENKHYEKCTQVYDQFLEDTSTASAPWYVIDAQSRKWAELQIMEYLTSGIDVALKNHVLNVPLLQNVFPLQEMPKLSEIPLDKTIEEDDYRVQLKELQAQLGALHNQLYEKKIPVVIVYEGWDAAGKGGNIKRLTAALDPRGYEVIPIASPKPFEKDRHFLWRFWTRLPKTGHISIFDRSWYGRVMVERLEGFCSENDWQRAYNEINEFEKELGCHHYQILGTDR
jgi:polyphosphate kinase 2 (PPK2 family)